jgi:hypothetical protein
MLQKEKRKTHTTFLSGKLAKHHSTTFKEKKVFLERAREGTQWSLFSLFVDGGVFSCFASFNIFT